MTKEELDKLLERVEKLEKGLQEKDEKIKSLEQANTELSTKLATAKVDGLVKKVEEVEEPKVENEEITFDFDMQ